MDYLIANFKPITLPREYNSCFHIEAIQRALKGRPRKNGVGRVPMFGNDTPGRLSPKGVQSSVWGI